MSDIPYAEIDSNVVELIKALNAFPDIVTTSSCGGHRNSKPYQKPEGEWEIFLSLVTVEGKPTDDAWTSIELLAFAFTKVFGGTGLRVVSADPFLNGFGDSISYVAEGKTSPDSIARELENLRKEFMNA